MKPQKIDAIVELVPNAKCSVNYKGEIRWFSENLTQPSEEEIQSKLAELLAAEPMRLLREERNRRLQETDWMANSDVTMTDDWKTYRQALRDLPSTASPKIENGQLTNVTWPTKPE